MKHGVALAFLIWFCMCAGISYADNYPTPAGLWLARSPLFGDKPLGIIKITVNNRRACGELIRVFPINGSFQTKAARRSSSGPTVMCGYQATQPYLWTNGQLYEQTTAQLYPSDLKLSTDGNHLTVTGYSGPFSKAAVWDRVK